MSGNLSKETSVKFKQKLSASLSDILGCRPEAATEKIKKIMNESGLIPQGVSSKSFEVRLILFQINHLYSFVNIIPFTSIKFFILWGKLYLI